MKRKGFTLIELLAVIVILAIIALIATPTILNLIEDSRKESVKISFENYLNSINQTIARENLKDNFSPKYCTLKNKKLLCDGKEIDLNIDNDSKVNGIIAFDNNKIDYYGVEIDSQMFTNIDTTCFISTIPGEINHIDLTRDECKKYKYIIIPSDLELPIATIESYSFNSEKCDAILKQYLSMLPKATGDDGSDTEITCQNIEYIVNNDPPTYTEILNEPTAKDMISVLDVDAISSYSDNKYKIDKIGIGAFSATKDFKGIYISSGISEIKDFSFTKSSIEDLILVNGVKTIGNGAFYLNNLKEVTIPNSVESIGDLGFARYVDFDEIGLPYIGGINNLTFEENSKLTTIGVYAFAYNNIESLNLPDSVTTIGGAAFIYNRISDLKLSSNITEIQSFSFSGNYLTELEIPNKVTLIDGFSFKANKLKEVTIPDNVVEIGSSAFDANSLEKVIIGNAIEKIGNWAFNDDIVSTPERTYGPNQITYVEIKKPEGSIIIESDIFSWADGYNDSNIKWN